MENREIVKELKSLCQLDIDAVHAYNQALDKIDLADVKLQIERFRGDHERHITDLSELIRTFNEEPPAFSRDFKGFILDAFTKIRSISGTEGALKALKSGEDITNRRYGDARNMDFPPRIREIIEANYRDEQRHLNYVQQAINDRIWEEAA